MGGLQMAPSAWMKPAAQESAFLELCLLLSIALRDAPRHGTGQERLQQKLHKSPPP